MFYNEQMTKKNIDSGSPIPLYHQIAEAIRQQIENGDLSRGDALAPLREAAQFWGVNLHTVRHAMETLTLDSGAMHLKDEMMPKYAEMVYNGFWFSPEREMMQASIDLASQHVTGTVRAKLYKGNVMIVGRKSPLSIYSEEMVTFEEDNVYDQRDAAGFIKLNALRLRLAKKIRG